MSWDVYVYPLIAYLDVLVPYFFIPQHSNDCQARSASCESVPNVTKCPPNTAWRTGI